MGNFSALVTDIYNGHYSDELLEKYFINKNSINKKDNSIFFIAKIDSEKKMVIAGEELEKFNFTGVNYDKGEVLYKICPLNNENAKCLRRIFNFTKPTKLNKKTSIGLGDRLGIATIGHIRTLKNLDIFPVFAQQSTRELNLTKRTYNDVIDDVSWAVFEEGYKRGYGADGDHLKSFREIEMALDAGCTMITLDCSEYINNDVYNMEKEEIENLYSEIDEEKRINYQSKFLGKSVIGDYDIYFNLDDLMQVVLVYDKAIDFAEEVYNRYLKDNDNVLFEISIDETLVSTTFAAHYFIADCLIKRGVVFEHLAPKFCGEFQKGIDYIGDIFNFEEEFKVHFAIAELLGYKISIHSGSDKFNVFPIINGISNGKFHLKTAGTNWLEAIRVISIKNPDLYRQIHKYAIKTIDEAKKYYHIGAKLENIPDIDVLKDDEIKDLLNQNDTRQYIHITYGLILNVKYFKDEIYKTLNQNYEDYIYSLKKHIGKHLRLLGI